MELFFRVWYHDVAVQAEPPPICPTLSVPEPEAKGEVRDPDILCLKNRKVKKSMKFVIQRVADASVEVENAVVGSIGKGFMVLIGVGKEDTRAEADKLVKKMLGLRIFADPEGKTNLSLKDVKGELLLISQFTLYANCTKGNRPSFTEAGDPETARKLYEYIIQRCREQVPVVETGIFGAEMKVCLCNDGPFTILLES